MVYSKSGHFLVSEVNGKTVQLLLRCFTCKLVQLTLFDENILFLFLCFFNLNEYTIITRFYFMYVLINFPFIYLFFFASTSELRNWFGNMGYEWAGLTYFIAFTF